RLSDEARSRSKTRIEVVFMSGRVRLATKYASACQQSDTYQYGRCYTYFFFSCSGSTITFWISRLRTEIITAARMAVPKPSITKESPINDCVSINVMALITNKNRPNDSTVTGKVNRMSIGLTMTFNIDRITLAKIAAPTPSK